MVLQRGMPVRIWGMAKPGEAIAVAFRAQKKTTQADDKGTGRSSWIRSRPGDRIP
jgi:hypothetical protein